MADLRHKLQDCIRRWTTETDAVGLLFTIPGLLLLVAILAYPVFEGLWLSLQHYDLSSIAAPFFVGLQNYVQAFHSDDFLAALWHTLYIVAVALVLEFVLGLALAHLFNQEFPFRRILLGLILVPWMVAPVVAALVWSQLLNESYGIVNYFLLKTGLIHHSVGWLTNPTLALHVMIGVDVWHETPFVFIILLAGLQGINKDVYEAAELDGAGPWQRLWFVTLPMLRPAIALALLLRTMIALRFFDIPWIMTGGGPAGATEVLGTRSYEAAFTSFKLGYGSAIATVILFLSLILSLAYIKILYQKRAS